MAQILCEESLETKEAGVRELCSWLKEYLPDSYLIFHNLDITFVSAEAGIKETESDVLIFAEPLGFLNIEVKSHDEIRQDPRTLQWYGKSKKGKWGNIADPFKQSQRTIWLLIRKIEKTLGVDKKDLPFVWGHAVAFPNALIKNTRDFPPNAPRELTIDLGDRKRIKKAIEGIFELYAKQRSGKRKATPKEFRALQDRVLMPGYRAIRTLANRVESYEDRYLRATKAQCRILDSLEVNARVLVEGCPGSGKTLLAMEKAKRLSSSDVKVLLLCYNISLGAFLRASLYPTPNLDIFHFHGLAEELCAKAGIENKWNPPGPESTLEDVQRFWNEESNRLLRESIQKLESSRVDVKYDAIIIDEAQDFRADWCDTIMRLIRNSETDHLYVFSGPHQMLFREERDALPSTLRARQLIPTTYTLDRNCRNSKKIGRLLSDVLGEAFHPEDFCDEGYLIGYYSYALSESQADGVAGILGELIERQGLSPEQIVLLTCHRREDFILGKRANVGPWRIVPYEPDYEEGTIRFSSVAAFKGLESDVIILCDIDWDPMACDTHHLATGISRAKHVLYLLFAGDWQLRSHRPGMINKL